MKCGPVIKHMTTEDCCCGSGHGHHGQFLSKKKKIEMLRKHADALKEKIEDIEEFIKELEGK